jgi:hypothetical protein
LIFKWFFEQSGVVHLSTSTFSTMRNGNVSSKSTREHGERNVKPAKSELGSNGGADVAGFVKLEALGLDHQAP